MSDSTAMIANSSSQCDDELGDMFADLPELNALDIKKDEIATNLAALMSFSGVNRSSMAAFVQWQKSRITKVLSGRGNPTITTIWEFCTALGYDFDVVFRSPEEECVKQPWERAHLPWLATGDQVHLEYSFPQIAFTLQSAAEVAGDLVRGQGRAHYLSISDDRSSSFLLGESDLLGTNPLLVNQLNQSTMLPLYFQGNTSVVDNEFQLK